MTTLRNAQIHEDKDQMRTLCLYRAKDILKGKDSRVQDKAFFRAFLGSRKIFIPIKISVRTLAQLITELES